MNDLTQPFVIPRAEAGWLRTQARWLRRGYARSRLRLAGGEQIKRWNSELNWREFWHGQLQLESSPRLIQVGTNWTCNLKCSFCRLTMPWTREQLGRLPAGGLQLSPRVEAVVERLLPRAEMLTLTPLGEPLLWSGLKDLLELHRSAGSRNLAMTTNGMLLNDRNCERLVRGQLAELYVSIDSNDPTVYAGMRVGGDLREVEAGVRRLMATRRRLGSRWPRLHLNATFMERNIHQLPSMVDWAKQLGFEQFSVQLMEIENPEHESEFLGHHVPLARLMVMAALARGQQAGLDVRPHLALRNLLSASHEGRDVSRHEFLAASPIMPASRRQAQSSAVAPAVADPSVADSAEGGCNGCSGCSDKSLDSAIDMRGKTLVEKCHYPWYNLLIDTDGDARPCCWADASWGNLNQISFEDAWNGQAALQMRRMFLANDIPASCRKKHCRVDL